MTQRSTSRERLEDMILMVVNIFASYCDEDFFVKERTVDSLLRHPTAVMKKELKRLGIPKSRAVRCLLGLIDDGEWQIAAVWVKGKSGQGNFVIIGDQERIYGSCSWPLPL